MDCQACTAPMVQVYGQAHFHCVTCNRFEFDNSTMQIEEIRPIGKQTPFQCPHCECALEVGFIHDQMQICFCPNCRGFVIDNESLGHLTTHLRRTYKGTDDIPTPINPAQLEKREFCPACRDAMDVHPYFGPGSIVIDTCQSCQLAWLDHGELGRIVRAPGKRPS